MADLVYANRKTKRYHSNKRGNQCRQGEILKVNLVKFANPETAKASGYKACKACYPA
jgi:methylphosphotriester-DNA--protein-cysteine methyltransferase